MYSFGKRSTDNLNTAHSDLQRLFKEVIKKTDCTVICGHRTPEQQRELYSQGRTRPGHKVTNIDGVNIKSKHNYSPSLAVDVVPYPIDWNDIERFKALGNIVKDTAKKMNIGISWGGDWKSFNDYPHYQIK